MFASNLPIGQAKAEAQSRAWTSKIEAESALEQADLKNKATNIEWVGRLNWWLQ